MFVGWLVGWLVHWLVSWLVVVFSRKWKKIGPEKNGSYMKWKHTYKRGRHTDIQAQHRTKHEQNLSKFNLSWLTNHAYIFSVGVCVVTSANSGARTLMNVALDDHLRIEFHSIFFLSLSLSFFLFLNVCKLINSLRFLPILHRLLDN